MPDDSMSPLIEKGDYAVIYRKTIHLTLDGNYKKLSDKTLVFSNNRTGPSFIRKFNPEPLLINKKEFDKYKYNN